MKMVSLLLFMVVIISSSEILSEVSLALTIYNDDFAMVKEVRNISFQQGISNLYFTDVSSKIQSETVTFKALTQTQNIRVIEQNYEANLINTDRILQKYLGKEIQIYSRLGLEDVKINGTLLGYSSGYILKTTEGIQVLNQIEGIRFQGMPQGFYTLPTLNWRVYSRNQVQTKCEIAYRTTGFSWKSDYTITVNEDETHADLGGWVTIDNRSGKRYKDAKLKLIAGDVKTVKKVNPIIMYMQKNTKSTIVGSSLMGDAPPSFSQKSFADYHMYTLSQPVSLNDNSAKQVQFIPKAYNISIRKYNQIQIKNGGLIKENLKASNKIEISNTQKNELGIPLPKGTVRVFKVDKADGSLQFIGEDSINHTPKDQNITLTTGNSFDITANKLVNNYQSFKDGGYNADLNLTIFNHKNIPTEVVINLATNGGDNLKITWKTQGLNIEKVSSQLLKVKRTFSANEKVSILWNQNYRG